MQQLLLFLFSWPPFPGGLGQGPSGPGRKALYPSSLRVFWIEPPSPQYCATSATSCSRGPNSPGGPAQPQLSPVRACSARISPAWLYRCGSRTLPGKKGPPPSALAHKILLIQQGPGPSALLVRYSLAILHSSGLMKCFIFWVPTTQLHFCL